MIKKIQYKLLLCLCWIVGLGSGLSSCSLEDDRDLCCDEITLHYRYVRQVVDEYGLFVRQMRHFLFDASGRFVREIPSDPRSPQDLVIKGLDFGSYTVLTVGNQTDANTQLPVLEAGKTTVQEFTAAVVNGREGLHTNGDELFWNAKTFEVKAVERQRYVCDLSNIHAHLFVKVSWEVLPPYDGTYTLRLEQVPVKNLIEVEQPHHLVIRSNGTASAGVPASTEEQVVHTFLQPTELGMHAIDVPLFNLELEGEFVTLRYTEQYIPVLRLYHGTTPVTKPIELSRAFQAWGWNPDKHPEQIYRIELRIQGDGKIVVSQQGDVLVNDWIQGGVIYGNT